MGENLLVLYNRVEDRVPPVVRCRTAVVTSDLMDLRFVSSEKGTLALLKSRAALSKREVDIPSSLDIESIG